MRDESTVSLINLIILNVSFECPPIADDGKCHYKGKSYELAQEFAKEDLSDCQVHCACRQSYSS